MFKKNAAVTGFWIGNFISVTDGSTVTTGTPTCKRTLDGTAGACANAAAYDATGLGWKIDLAAGDFNGDMVGLSFTLAGCIPISYTIRTSTALVSEMGTSTYAGADTAGTTELLTRIPDATPGAAGGLPTVDANNYVAGIAGTKNQFDDLAAAPTASAIASQVRTELAVELGQLSDILAVTSLIDVTAVTQVSQAIAGHLAITVGLTFNATITGLTIPSDWDVAIWTLKRSTSDTDAKAILQLRSTNGVPATPGDDALTVTQAAGSITIYLTDETTADLDAESSLGWDVKFIDAAGDSTGRRGTAEIMATETQALV